MRSKKATVTEIVEGKAEKYGVDADNPIAVRKAIKDLYITAVANAVIAARKSSRNTSSLLSWKLIESAGALGGFSYICSVSVKLRCKHGTNAKVKKP